MTPAEFRHRYAECFYLAQDEPENLAAYLTRIGVLGEAECLCSVAPAGEGNMNLTLRVATDQRSLIVKQSRPWVERYPSIAAPRDRVLGEARFYTLISRHDEIVARTPRLIEIDAKSRVMVLEDLGVANDDTGLYGDERLAPPDAERLADWLGRLHRLEFDATSMASLTNREMRTLNHEHLFQVPLDPRNGLDLDAITPGLASAAAELAADADYADRAAQLGELYLIDGPTLLHGDYFPGSWLRGEHGLRVIDPEFAFFGPAEFDVGVMLGHLYLSGQDDATHAAVIGAYEGPLGFDWRLAIRFAGIEIMRRLIGVAQLPLAAGIDRKRELLHLSREFVLSPNPTRCDRLRCAAALLERDETRDELRDGATLT